MSKYEIETLIDNKGLEDLLETIEIICNEKAAHIETTYGDLALTEKWDKASVAINKAKIKIGKLEF